MMVNILYRWSEPQKPLEYKPSSEAQSQDRPQVVAMESYRKKRLFHFLWVAVAVADLLGVARCDPRTPPPLHAGQPFLFLWNAPTELCESRFGVPLDLRYFQEVSSTLRTATNQSVSIFYTDRFGLFPYVDEDTGERFEDGLPQLVNMAEHRDEAHDDIVHYIPDQRPGLAVLDFEEWRPQWSRNWGSKDIYRDFSILAARKKYPTLSDEEVETRAQESFERGARKFFLKSLQLGKNLRAGRLWGYYLYPDCYNYDYHQDMTGYSGECPELEQRRNDELLWLWKESDALYPSIYLERVLARRPQARHFVRHRIQEAVRVSRLADPYFSTPIYPYIRPVFKDSVDDYLSEYDLVNTIGEAAALGAAGVVSWGDMQLTDDENSCVDAKLHLEKVMNPYILNVSTAAKLCSWALCGGAGRCVRKHWDTDHYLHLDPLRWTISRVHGGRLTVKGARSMQDVDWFRKGFSCMCFTVKPCYKPADFNFIVEEIQGNRQPPLRCRLGLLAAALLCVLLMS